MDQQRKALQSRGGQPAGTGFDSPQGGAPGQQGDGGIGSMGQPQSPVVSSTPFSLQAIPPSPHTRQPSAIPNMPSNNLNGLEGSPGPSLGGYSGQPSTSNLLDQDQDGFHNKRKLESEEPDLKRARQKTGESIGSICGHMLTRSIRLRTSGQCQCESLHIVVQSI